MIIDEFKGQLKESLRVVIKAPDGQIYRHDCRFYGVDGNVAILASGKEFETWPLDWCLVPIDHNPDGATITLMKTLDWINQIGECDG